jgi:hypothetical protein
MLRKRTVHPADFAFSSLLSGALGSAAIALFFLAVDSFRGEPFFTPSLMGSVLFLGSSPIEVVGARIDMMAAYTIVHLAAFVLLGSATTWVWTRARGIPRHPLALSVLVLAALSIGALGMDALIGPGLLSAIGALSLTGANVAASLVMGIFIHRTVEQGAATEAAVMADAPATRSSVTR